MPRPRAGARCAAGGRACWPAWRSSWPLAAAVLRPAAHDAVQEITLPLRHEDIIRQQARDKDLDPALIAGVIYAESKFRDQTSPAGADGPDADHAADGARHRPQVGRHGLRGGRPGHARR